MWVVDASVWVSRLVSTELNHEISRRWLHEIISSGALIAAPSLLLVEVASAIVRRTDDSSLGVAAFRGIQTLPNLRLVALDATLAEAAAKLGTDLRLRGADATYVAVAHHLGVPIVTWDQEQLRRAEALVQVLEPA